MKTRNLLLTLCAVLEAAISILFLAQGTAFLGKLTLAAAACALAAGLWRTGAGKSWLLVLNGLAVGALGVIFNSLFRYRISFRTIALLLGVMALSSGLMALKWSLRAAGAASLGLALALFALALRWIPLGSAGRPDLMWLGASFGLSALCMMALVTARGSIHAPTGRAWL
uniref:Uncharacterized protein n=1 Tax=Solibacter usitatus (strain Ellin6076) TaxID=234267 RepID=Q020D1_SOLUE